MSRLIFVNLPVADLATSVEFFTGLGFTFNSQFTDEHATCMVISEQAFVMLLVRPFFASFVTKDVADPAVATGAIVSVSAHSREEVDGLVDRALALGGAVSAEPQDEGFMYGRSFYDPDGHAWEVMWMDPAAVQ
jgi:hypothetical protein